MKHKNKLIFVAVAGMVFLYLVYCAFGLWRSGRTVAHQRPYRWDAFALPQQVFSNATVVEIASQVNELISKTSNGSVTQAVCVDTALATIDEAPSDFTLKDEMDRLVANYRQDETNWLTRGACGFETCRYTGTFMARHSLGCEFQSLADWAELSCEEKPDAIHLGRYPNRLECRVYQISSRLNLMAESLKQNQIRVDMDSVTSAFVDVTRVSLWSIDVPTGPNEKTGEFRAASVFKHLPEKSVLLVIETPEAHATAAANLKEQGLLDSH